jgi:hypothetical protein
MAVRLHGEPAMRSIEIALPLVIVALLDAGAARADDTPVSAESQAPRIHLALGINSPLSWIESFSRGASLYVGFAGRHALRANLARHSYHSSVATTVVTIAAGSDGDEASYAGHITDTGLAWVYYPRGKWSGWTCELGILRRARDHRNRDEFAMPEVVETRTTSYAGRAMLGWTWQTSRYIFVAIAAGGSIGRESGSETTQRHAGETPMRASVSRTDLELEGLLRVGAAFDL